MRSETMSYLRVLIPSEAAFAFVDELGKHDVMEFVDLNEGMQSFTRRYMKEIVRISDLERKVRLIAGHLDSHDVAWDSHLMPSDAQNIRDDGDALEALENEIGEVYRQLSNDINAEDELKRQLERSQDMELVLTQVERIMEQKNDAQQALVEAKEHDAPAFDPLADDHQSPLLAHRGSQRAPDIAVHGGGGGGDLMFKFFAGVVSDVQRPSFERQVYLMSRGNTYPVFVDVPGQAKSIYAIFFLGNQIFEKLDRLCKFMSVEVFLTSETASDIPSMLDQCRETAADLDVLLAKTSEGVNDNLVRVSRTLKKWTLLLLQMKSVCTTLNRFKPSKRTNILTAEGWCPTSARSLVQSSVNNATDSKGMAPSVVVELKWEGTGKVPPTHFNTNKYTSVFQTIVDTYGAPRYKEINPTVFTIITFPFLYAIMYGDVFHGSCITLFAIYLIVREASLGKQKLNEFIEACYAGRYLLLLMGLFAIYCGVLYNDAMAVPLHLFKSGWSFDGVDHNEPANQISHVYPVGVDYAWYHADNELAFFNGLKMKMAVVFGVTQMSFGLFVGLANMIYFGDMLSILTEFIPQLIFLMSLFGYMCFMIIYKWVVNWPSLPYRVNVNTPFDGPEQRSPPSIISVMIDMMLNPGSINPADEPKVLIYNDPDFQNTLHLVLLALAFISIPWMLFPKPLILRHRHKNRKHIPLPQGPMEEKPIQGSFSTDNMHDVTSPSTYIRMDSQRDEGKAAHAVAAKVISSSDDSSSGDDSYDDSLAKKNGGGGGAAAVAQPPAYEDLEDADDGVGVKVHVNGEDEFEFGEVFINQLIHTIEYVLGTISNTASYLRLWALSLAHAELSKVIYEQILLAGFQSGSFFIIFGAAPAFFVVTFAVLLTMDVLECFLHALRLHWVEFQVKFYKADGIPFVPFSYKRVIAERAEQQSSS